jgi:hypothetical protein
LLQKNGRDDALLQNNREYRVWRRNALRPYEQNEFFSLFKS